MQAQCLSGNCTDGYGKFRFNKDDTYEGNWKESKLNGYGVYTWKNGDIYTGAFSNNQRSGKGKLVYKDGTVYEGNWANDLYSGDGLLSWPNKNRYEGKFFSGMAEGAGKFYRNGTLFYEGYFDGTNTYSSSKVWLLRDGRFARRTRYSDGSIFEIWNPDMSMFIGVINDLNIYDLIDWISPKEGALLMPDGKVVSGEWENGNIKKLNYQYKMKMTEGLPDYIKGRIFYAYKKYDDALKSFNKAVGLGIKEDSVYLYRGGANYQLKRYDSAKADLSLLLKKQPKSKEGLSWRAQVLIALKDSTGAITDYNTYIKNFPSDSVGYWQRAILYHNMKNYTAAVQDYTQYLQRTKAGNDNVYYYRGICYELLEKKTEACADFEKAKKGGNKNADAKIKKLCGSPG